jgi:hypothetical protein
MDQGAFKFATTTSSAGRCTQQISGGGVDRFALALPGFLLVATARQQWSRPDGDKIENSILLYEGILKGLPLYGSFGVLCPRGRYTYIGRRTRHVYIN